MVYNSNGYHLALDALFEKEGRDTKWSKPKFLEMEYMQLEEQPLEIEVLERNVIYLSGMWKGTFSKELYEEAREKFIRDALRAGEEKVDDTIDYLVNGLACRPSTATELNELSQIYQKVSLKSDEMTSWQTVLMHVFQMHDCKYK